ncbi:thiamine pyrophosphate enzyme [Legionella oakridgensis RV-2-2007]|nr:thiamine pyrophosphate enzyme [Legionella oakridgensis RV-2-2007]
MKKGWEVLKEFIESNHIKYVFGNPGTTETTFLAALAECRHLEYILALQESSVIGIAAGYAMVTKKPAIVNVHTYPGLANSLCNLYNAFTSGIPLLITVGQQDRRHLIYNPVLSGNLTGLAATAVKYACEVQRIDDFALLLQRL